jgi:hypothetical protein
MNDKSSTRKERILINLDKAEISVLDNLAAESRRTRSNVISVLIGKANHDAQIKAVLGGGR